MPPEGELFSSAAREDLPSRPAIGASVELCPPSMASFSDRGVPSASRSRPATGSSNLRRVTGAHVRGAARGHRVSGGRDRGVGKVRATASSSSSLASQGAGGGSRPLACSRPPAEIALVVPTLSRRHRRARVAEGRAAHAAVKTVRFETEGCWRALKRRRYSVPGIGSPLRYREPA